MTQAHPLAWPLGWERTPKAKQGSGYNFKQEAWRGSGEHTYKARVPVTFANARDKLYKALDQLRATNAVISSNHPTDARGTPIESKRKIEDEGVAVYFQYRDRPRVMACDRYDTAAANMRSLGLQIDYMRGLERHGGGVMLERAFEGFAALPPPKSCWETLGIAQGSTAEQIKTAWRKLVGEAHPDREGGSGARTAELNAARDEALKQIKG